MRHAAAGAGRTPTRAAWAALPVAGLLVLATLLVGCGTPPAGPPAEAATPEPRWLTTKTPYHPGQPIAAYEPPPPGFAPVHTQLVARHGTRGMTSPKDELALLNLWRAAAAEGALTPLGQGLGPDLEALIRSNALLGHGVEGITRPGYGNLTRIGIEEHTQLAQRVLQRLPALFEPAAQDGAARRRITVQHSGVDRAADSAEAFMRSLLQARPALAPLVERPVLQGYPADAPRAQAPGVDRFRLYFHRLNARNDLVTDPTDPALAVYRASLAYQAYARSAAVKAKVNEARADPALAQAAVATLQRLFTPAFVERLARGQASYPSTGSFEFTSDDGSFKAKVVGDGKASIRSPMDALLALYAVYEIAPGLRREPGARDFARYLPEDAARLMAWANDAEDFYVKGPGIAEDRPVNHAMARGLLEDFFRQALAAADGGERAGMASFRFTHAEIIIPLASALGLDAWDVPVPRAQLYRYETNPWRGEQVSGYAANVQWDIWRDASGTTLVRMLYNERQTAFKRACDGARQAPGSFFYDLRRLHACYATD